MRGFFYSLLFLALASVHVAHASTINLSPHLDHLFDADGQWSVEEVQDKKSWVALDQKNTLNLGFVKEPTWLRVEVRKEWQDPNEDQFIVLSKIQFRSIAFYQLINGVVVKQHQSGTDMAFNSREIELLQWAFRLRSATEDSQILIRLETNSPIHSRIELVSTIDLLKRVAEYELYYGMILGFFSLMMLLALVLALTRFEPTVAYGTLVITGSLFVSLSHSGLGFQYLWPNHPELNPILHRYTLAFTISLIGLFTIELLGIKTFAPKLARATKIGSIFLMCIMLFPIFKFSPPIGIAIYLTVPALTLLCALRARLEGIHGSVFILLGFVAFLSSILISSVASLGVLPDHLNYAFVLDSGMVVMILIMAYGFAVKLNSNLLDNAVTSESIKAKSLFFATMSHEIRTPINGVLGMLTLLSKENLSEPQQRLTDHAKSSAQSLVSLINDILDLSKVEAGKLDLEPLTFNLVELLEEVVESFAYSAKPDDVELILDTHSITQPSLLTDPGRLRQILNNLISNALKFTSVGEVEVRARLVDSGSEQRLIVSVRDTGIGISAENLAKVFNVFTQAENSTNRKYGGTGLGLSIAQQLCELLGGEITATSKVGKGSTFSFSISVEISKTQPKADWPELSGTRTLIHHPNHAGLDAIGRYLETWGSDTNYAKTKEQLLRNLEQTYFDLVICCDDLELPEHYILPGKLLITGTHNSTDAHKLDEPIVASQLIRAIRKDHSEPAQLTTTSSPAVQNESITVTETPSDRNTKPFKILLVEDNFINTEVALGMLEDCGYIDVELAENGQEAINRLKAESFDLVLMDCQMPIVDGYEATRQIRSGQAGDLSKLPVIAMTANAMQGDREKCLAVGMDDYIPKPIDPEKLARTLNNWLPS